MKPISKFARSVSRPVMLAAILLSLLGGAIFATPARAATFTVTKTADTNDGVCNADCSLREAIGAANASGGADIITLPAGTYQLTLANAGGTNEDSNATGDLDILDSVTINGAGSGSTIIQAGTNNTNGIDKVIAINPICTSIVNATIDGVTIRYGYNSQPISAPDFSFSGGGIDYCAGGGGTSGTFTLSNSIVSDNTNLNAYGGGLNTDAYLTASYTVNITNVTFQNNRTLTTVNTGTGGAINLWGDQVTAIITGSTFTGNTTANATSAGGAIYFRPSAITPAPTSSLSVSNSTFSSNTAAGSGGAIGTGTYGTGTTVAISNSSFTGNTATNSFGGALYLDSSAANTTPFSLTHLTITGNTAGSAGGGLFIGNSNVTMSKSFIVGNNAPTAKGLRKSVDATTATVTNNWWGCSTTPASAPCDTVSTAGGTLTFSPWYRDQLTATTSPIVTNQSTSLTASFLTNSAGSAVPVADISEIIGKSVTWAATNGNLSSTQATVQAAGTATGSFQATAAGTAIISAKVSNDNTSPVSSNVLSLTVNKANTTTAIGTDSPDPSVTGQPVTVTYSVTGQFGNSPTAPTGNVTVTDGTDSCTGTVAAGQCNITFRTAGAKTITATYAGDANFNASPASASASHTVNKADTTTIITSDTPDPSVTGQTVTFNVTVAAVAPGAAVAPTTITGSVTVSDGGSNSCIATLTAGAGSCTIDFPAVGVYTMDATYGGDSNFNGSVSATNSHTVNKADTTTTITSDNPDPSDFGETVTVNFTVNVDAPGAGTPTGNVTVSDGTDSCIDTVAAGTCNITFTSAGSKSLTATYAGDSNFNGSASSPATPHTVSKADTSTTITLDSPDPSVVGEVVTVNFTVAVTPPGSGTLTGNVTVSDGTDSCIGTVASGTCNITFTSAGSKSLAATYAGDSNFNGSASSPVTAHTVNAADTTTTITSDLPDPSVVGESVTVNFTVAVTAPGSGAPTGNVTVSDGTDSCIGTAASGTCNITFTSPGSKSLTATYAGDSNFNGSASSPATPHTVNNADTTTNITSDLPDPSVFGELVTVNFTVTVDAPGAGTPTGNVTVGDGTDSCIGTVASGTCNITFTSPGSKSLTATYAGDSNFNGSASSPATSHTVNKADTTTSITSDLPDPSLAGTSVTVNFTMSITPPGSGTLTGNVTVSDGVDSCIGTVASGTCDITLTTIGSRTLTATYAGDSNFNGSSSSGEPHTVSGYSTTTTITSDSPDASVVGQAVTVQYSVTTGTGTPTGNVTVSDGVDSCIGTVAAGQCNITFTSAGAKSLTATYAGDATHEGSVSALEAHQVDKADTTTTITSDSPDPSSAIQSVTVNFTVAVNLPGSGTPTGNVTVSDGVDSCIGTVAAGTCSLTLTTGGARTLTATYAGDSNFNGSASSGEPHTVDATAPGVTIDQAIGQLDPTTSSTINFTVVFSEAVSDFDDATDVSLSGTAGATTILITGGPITYNVAVSGMTTVGTVIADVPAGVATDAVGNLNTASTSGDNIVSFTDTTAPDTNIYTQPSDPSNSADATFAFNGTDNLTPPGSLTFECDLDGGGFSSCTSPQNYLGLSDGSHTFQVRAKDAALNVDASPASFTWTIDTTAPTVTIDQAAGQSDPTTGLTINFTVVFSESVSVFDGSDVTLGGTAGATTAVVTGGPSTYNVAVSGMSGAGTVIADIPASSASDAAGNDNAASTSADNTVTYVPDTTPPDTTINSGPTDPSTSNDAAFTFSGTDDHTLPGALTFECQLDGGGFSSCTSPQNYTGLAIGSHTFEVQATDGAGNVDPTPATFPWEVIAGPTFTVVNGVCRPAITSVGTLNLLLFDPEGDQMTVRLVSNTNTTLVPNRYIIILGRGTARTVMIGAIPNRTGTATITLEVTDGVNSTPIVINFQIGTTGADTLNGTSGIDMLIGLNGNDTLNGNGGNDLLCGGNGNDALNGDDGNDILDGLAGNDVLSGGNNNDILRGSIGIDTLTGGLGADFFSGGLGVDILTDYNTLEGDTKDWSSP